MVDLLIPHLEMEVPLVDLVVEDLETMLHLHLELLVQVLLVKVMQVVLVLILVVVLITTNKVVAVVELVKLATLMQMDMEEMEEICLQNLEPHMVKVESSVVEELVVQELLVANTTKVDLVEVVTLVLDIRVTRHLKQELQTLVVVVVLVVINLVLEDNLVVQELFLLGT